MAKKKKKQPKQGHPARLAQQVVSLSRVKVNRGVDALTPDFVRWYEQNSDEPGMATMVLSAVRETLGVYAEVVGLDSIHDFDPTLMHSVIGSMIDFEESEPDGEEDSDQLRMLLFICWSSYLDFLEDTERWTQDLSALDWLRQSLDLEDDPFTGDEVEERGGIHSLDASALRDMMALPVVALGRELANWSLTGPNARWDGYPDSQFIAAITEALGRPVLTGLTPERTARVMEHIFAALIEAQVLELGKSLITQAAATRDFLHDGSAAHGPTYKFVQAFLDLMLEAPESPTDEELQGWGLTNLWLLGAIEGESHRVAEPSDGSFGLTVWSLAHARMADLRVLGLVQEGDYYTVPRVVAVAVTDVGDQAFDDELDEDQLDAIFGSDPEDEPKRDRRAVPYSGNVLQLKLGLQNAKPPIWRRVLVPMDLNLGDLHDIIQTAFEWYDGHLHQFSVGRTTYGPIGEFADNDHDESKVLVAQLLGATKDRLDYAYDFGDGWEIRIEVEKVLDSDTGQLPRCTGGRRMAPLENSGGTWGWAAKLEALADPTHEEHEETVEWLEESGYEQLDPAVCSIEAINQALSTEF